MPDTPRDKLRSVLTAMRYAEDTLRAYEALPHNRAHAFAHRNGCLPGDNVWEFLMKWAEENE